MHVNKITKIRKVHRMILKNRPVDPRVASRGVTDLYPSRGLNIEHARTTFRKLVKLSINYIVSLVHKHHITN